MVRTNNKKETIEALWNISKRTGTTNDNHFFIDKDGCIKGHGYLQGNGDYFPSYPKGTTDITVMKGMKKKDIISEVNRAMSEEF